jgi:DNA-binding transcriptional ArsR family regulator
LPSPADRRGGSIDAVFAALADPTRRDVVRRLAAEPSTATELAGKVPVSRQAVAKHLSTLERAGLVDAERDGRHVRYRLTPSGFTDVVAWVSDVGAAWDSRLAALQRHVANRRGQTF